MVGGWGGGGDEPCLVKTEIPDPWVLTSDHQNVKLLR